MTILLTLQAMHSDSASMARPFLSCPSRFHVTRHRLERGPPRLPWCSQYPFAGIGRYRLSRIWSEEDNACRSEDEVVPRADCVPFFENLFVFKFGKLIPGSLHEVLFSSSCRSDLNENNGPSGISFALVTVAVRTMSPDISTMMSTPPRIALDPRGHPFERPYRYVR